jgi:hypothetical protein
VEVAGVASENLDLPAAISATGKLLKLPSVRGKDRKPAPR